MNKNMNSKRSEIKKKRKCQQPWVLEDYRVKFLGRMVFQLSTEKIAKLTIQKIFKDSYKYARIHKVDKNTKI